MATVAVVPRPECHGHPIKLLNYMMAAKPIVCFEAGAKGGRHLHDAYILPNHDWEKMGEAIVTLIRDPALAKRLAAEARGTGMSNIDSRNFGQEIAANYD